jgi:Fur family ferric uptake transcriptional regulator
MRKTLSRWTLAREAVLDLLFKTSKHMSAREIYDALVRTYPGIGLSTVYRTLDFFTRKDLVNKLDVGEGQCRYEYKNEEEKVHHHLICTKCGKIFDYGDFTKEELHLIKKAESHIAGKYNFLVQDYNIEFYGICENCQ